MLLSLIILYVITLIYLSIVERFRNYASIIAFQGWILLGIALLRLHSLDWVELSFVILEDAHIQGPDRARHPHARDPQDEDQPRQQVGIDPLQRPDALGAALAASAVTTYYVADQSVT